MKSFFLNHKNEIKYKDVEHEAVVWVRRNNTNEQEVRKTVYTITGIGNKAIKYQKDHGEDEFVFYDNSDFYHIARIIAKSFDSEIWNEDIRSAIAAQKQYCRDNKAPHFAPEDGFCWSCGKQIYTRIDEKQAGKDLITGCPHCSRSYCD